MIGARMAEIFTIKVSEEEKRKILKEFDITEEQFEEDVKRLRQWLTMSPHLPQDDDDNKLRICLLNSKMSMEKAKKSLEGYYRVRTIYSDFFDKMLPSNEYFQKTKRCSKTVIMPKLTPDLCRITISKINDVNGEADDGLWYYAPALMMAEIRILHDIYLSNIIVIDMEHYNIKNFLKFTPSINRKLVNILNSVNLRIKDIHLLNCPPILDRVMVVVKSLLPAKLMSRMHVHTNYETLLQHIPKEYLPCDYGGTEPSLDELYADWCSEIEQREKIFQDLLTFKSKEEIDTPTREVFGMGTDGSFKKLNID